MSKVLQRQVVVVNRFLSPSEQSFRVNLGLNFTPTKVIVKSLSYGKNAQSGLNYTNGIVFPWCDGEIGGVIIDDNNNNFLSNPNTTFDLKNGGALMNGSSLFIIYRLTDSVVPHHISGMVSFTFEFLQEETQDLKPQSNDMNVLINYLKQRDSQQNIYPYSQLPTQLGKGHCMRGGADMEEEKAPIEPQMVVKDRRNPYTDQVNPIPSVHKLDVEPREEVEEEPKKEEVETKEDKIEEDKK